MAEYIKKTDVMKICKGYSEHCFNSNDSKGQDIADRILDDVVEIPTADVEEVKHAKWIPNSSYKYYYYCSNCGRSVSDVTENPNIIFPYCHCGAKMAGGKGE